MIVSIICALDHRNGIGIGGKLPWRLSTDLRRFKRITYGHHIIAGRKTSESIGRALPGRMMIILSRNPEFVSSYGIVVNSMDQALETAQKRGEIEVFIIGGAQIYKAAIDLANRFYLTRVHAVVQADVFFPDMDFSSWEILEKQEYGAEDYDQYPHTFLILERDSVTK